MLQNLENNIHTLIAAYEAQKKRADDLQKELDSMRASQEEAKKKVKELEGENDSLSLRSAFIGEAADKTQARRKVQSLIEQIDRALELLK